jgi:serpin B
MKPFVLALFLSAGIHAADEGVAAGVNRFATASYRELAPANPNLVFSPFSISSALSMTLTGARGRTADEMAAVLGQAAVDPGYHAALASLVERLAAQGNGGPNELFFANALWVQSGFAILPDFQNKLRSLYRAPLSPVDFAGNPEGARGSINSWTERQTRNRIRDLFGPGSPGRATRLVLTTAVYFNGKWQSAFRPGDTRPGPFQSGASGTVETGFMRQTADFGYADAPSVRILEMKYAGSPLAFDVILPKAAGGLAEIEKSLTPEKLVAWFAGLATRRVEVSIPRFRAEASFSLRETLSHMGMPLAFGAAADFSGIDDRRDLCLSDVVHKAFVDITEEGTEAAAASGAVVALIAARRSPAVVFRADHPFAFLIRDTTSGAILFAGRFTRPRGA